MVSTSELLLWKRIHTFFFFVARCYITLYITLSAPLPLSSDDIYDYVYIDAFGKGKQLTAKECEYLIRQQVTADYYSSISTTELLLRMVGNLLNIGKRG